MRSPSSGISSQLSAVVTQDGFLLQITPSGQATAYMTNLDVDFSYNSITWTSSDFDVTGINWGTTGMQAGKLVLGDSDLIWWDYALNLILQDSPVSIWQVYASAPTEAEPLWSGRIGSVTKGDQTVECTLNTDSMVRQVPTRRVQYVIPTSFLAPAGKVISIGSQNWVLNRQTYTGA